MATETRVNSFNNAYLDENDELVIYDPDEHDPRYGGYSFPKIDIFIRIKQVCIKFCVCILIAMFTLFTISLLVLLALCVYDHDNLCFY
jgi:hypothetical protein